LAEDLQLWQTSKQFLNWGDRPVSEQIISSTSGSSWNSSNLYQMAAVSETQTLTAVEEKIILTLIYYDIFNYPLKAAEVFRFLGTNHVTEEVIEKELVNLRKRGLVFQFGHFFSIQNNEHNALKRMRGNDLAEKLQPIAQRQARLIARFPFVRGVMASGSFSKGYMDQKSDLDFFIITEPRRLWIARTLLVFYKRLFLFNSHKYFCVNYFVDSEHLMIEEKNLFTATELATLIPLSGASLYLRLQQANAWIKHMFPNYGPRPVNGVEESARGWFKGLFEKLINLVAPTQLERFFQYITLRRWLKRYGNNLSAADFHIAFKTKDYVSKNHPNHYQKKIERLYADKVSAFQARLEPTWSYE
jgi:hypothetical protein